jgi:hypothetical protein
MGWLALHKAGLRAHLGRPDVLPSKTRGNGLWLQAGNIRLGQITINCHDRHFSRIKRKQVGHGCYSEGVPQSRKKTATVLD